MCKRLVAGQAFAHERRARPAGFICVNDPDLKLRFDHPDQKCERDSVFGTGVVYPIFPNSATRRHSSRDDCPRTRRNIPRSHHRRPIRTASIVWSCLRSTRIRILWKVCVRFRSYCCSIFGYGRTPEEDDHQFDMNLTIGSPGFPRLLRPFRFGAHELRTRKRRTRRRRLNLRGKNIKLDLRLLSQSSFDEEYPVTRVAGYFVCMIPESRQSLAVKLKRMCPVEIYEHINKIVSAFPCEMH